MEREWQLQPQPHAASVAMAEEVVSSENNSHRTAFSKSGCPLIAASLGGEGRREGEEEGGSKGEGEGGKSRTGCSGRPGASMAAPQAE